MNDVLPKILVDKRAHVAKLKTEKSFIEMDEEARAMPQTRGFTNALTAKIHTSDIGLITEIKKASPSAGIIRPNFSPKELARAYEEGGAACLSVLTDEPYFQGSNHDLIEAHKASTLPILRKDFIVDVWQVAEARLIGADCILIIMAALTDGAAEDIYYAAMDYGMDVLIEVHDRVELDRALRLPTGMIGINNRNLKTLKVDLRITEELVKLVPPDRLIVSESGLATPADIARMEKIGVYCFLIGESLLKKPDVATALLELRLN